MTVLTDCAVGFYTKKQLTLRTTLILYFSLELLRHGVIVLPAKTGNLKKNQVFSAQYFEIRGFLAQILCSRFKEKIEIQSFSEIVLNSIFVYCN